MRNVTDEYVEPIDAHGPAPCVGEALYAFGEAWPRPDLPVKELLDRVNHLLVVLERISMVRTQSLY